MALNVVQQVRLRHQPRPKIAPRLAVNECPVPNRFHAFGPFVRWVSQHLTPQLHSVELKAQAAVAFCPCREVKRLRPPEVQNINAPNVGAQKGKPDRLTGLVGLVMASRLVCADAERL